MLKYLGLQVENYSCTERMVRENGNLVETGSQPDITNSNIQIDCKRDDPRVTEVDGTGKVEYESGYISVNTSGPSFAVAFPEVVESYYVSPPQSVIAFASSICPQGWSEYEPAYGRFIRGVDNSGDSIDPDGVREIGHLQGDGIQSHYHTANGMQHGGSAVNNGSFRTDIAGGSPTQRHPTSGPVGASVAQETRPWNVALLYCRKN